tara:strand:+ start:232 stop:411 length:180 start_codon:yes stop_codon:yes gene_type:complete
MKYFMIFTLCVVTMAGLSACKTTADTRNDKYSIDLDNDHYRYNGGGNFCPPGHAKKGWC